MKVVKRNGVVEDMMFDKISSSIHELCQEHALTHVDGSTIAQKICTSLYDGIKTSEIDVLASETAASMSTRHPDYGKLAALIVVRNLHKVTPAKASEAFEKLHAIGFLSDEAYAVVQKHKDAIDDAIVSDRDNAFDYFGLKTLERGYLAREGKRVIERPQYMWMRVAVGIWYDDIDRVLETYNMLSQKCFTHATPTLFNAATKHPQLSSCFLMGVKEDSIDGIFSTLSDCAQISKWAGGIGVHIHNVRCRGSPIVGTSGVSSGIMPMLKVFNATARYVNQAGRRNGSIAIYLEPSHPDVFEILDARKNHGDEEARARDLFYALWIPDLFMKRVEAGAKWSLFCPNKCPGLADAVGEDYERLYESYESKGLYEQQIDAQKLWLAICTAQIETGTPFLLYKDACNKKSNQKHLGTIKSSNLCVAPETKILTREHGYEPIASLADQEVEVWNGEEWSRVRVVQTSDAAELMKLKFSDGTELECTPYHTFYIQNGYTNLPTQKKAHELSIGDKLIKWMPDEQPLEWETPEPFPHAYTHGAFCGDGTYNTDMSPKITLYKNKKDLHSTSGKETAGGHINVQLPKNLSPKFTVPLRASLKDRLDWLAGLSDTGGNIVRSPDNPAQIGIHIASIHKDFLNQVQLMLHTMGVHSCVQRLHEARQALMPDGKGGHAMYECQSVWRLCIASYGVARLVAAGFKTHRLDLTGFEPPVQEKRHFAKVTGIEVTGRVDATYCFNEPKRHMGVFNGVLTGNCTEIVEYTSPDEIAVCNLASMCLPKFVTKDRFDFEAFHAAVKVVTRNLDKVIDVTYYPMEAARRSNLRHRPIGIGVQGLADVFMTLHMDYEGEAARRLNRDIFETLYHAAVEASCERAEDLGPYPTFEGSPASRGKLQFDLWGASPGQARYDWQALKKRVVAKGLRNSLLIAPMPTASTSQIMGNNEAFEPYTSNIYVRRTLAGEFVIVNKHLVRDLMDLGLWNEDLKNKIVSQHGSVQSIQEIPDTLKPIYKTSWEMKQKSLIDMAADRAVFICQSQSLNLFVGSPTFAKLSSMHFYAWKRGLKTGMYYLRTQPVANPVQFTVDPKTCITCSS